MPFFQVDDQLHVNAKTTAMVEHEALAAAGPAMMLWTLGGSMAQAKLSDGKLTTGDITRLLLSRAAALRAARLLEKYRLWHGPGHVCHDCPPVEEGSWIFHQWGQMNYATGEQVKVARARRKETQNPEIVEAVWARDTDATGKAHCRYCAVNVSRQDRKSERRPTLDHVIPGLARGVTNLVVACLKCNRDKGQRTPEQAGFRLLDPPSHPPTTGLRSDPGSDLKSNRSESDPDLIPALPRGGARGQGRAGQGQGSGLDGSGLELAGRGGPGPAGQAPPTAAPDTFGSPWFGATGRPLRDAEEASCPHHALPTPCRKCAAESYAEEVSCR